MHVRLTGFRPFLSYVALLVVLVVMAAGCTESGSRRSSPMEPSGLSESLVQSTDEQGSRMCWGVWELSLDKSGVFEIVPLRSAQYRVNVNIYLQPPAGSLANMNVVIVNESQLMSKGRIVIDVSLTHPFPDYPEYAGFDVLGVFMHNGSYTARHDSKIKYADPGSNAILSNADGYTRWMNRSEFPKSGLGGYTEGRLGTAGIAWNATVNPYKYYCDGLSATESIPAHYGSAASVSNRGVFKAGRTNTRRYDLTFPMMGGQPAVRFQYAVVASWMEPQHIPPTNVPGDFPTGANMTEPFYVTADTDGSTVFYNSSSDKGGDLLLTLEIFDQGARTDPLKVEGQISEIIVESPNAFIPGTSHMLTFDDSDWTVLAGSTAISQKFVLDCGTVNPQGSQPDDNPILVAVRSKAGSYNTGTGTPYPTGALRAFQCFEIPMTGWVPEAPGNVTGFQASDGVLAVGHHRVELTWNEVTAADEYMIQRRDYDTGDEAWEWVEIYTALAGETSYLDANARYCGSNNPISYRIKAANSYGQSPAWSTDTGYPRMRGVRAALWCWASDGSGTGAIVPWSRGQADFNDANTFWNDYGFEFVMDNTSGFYWVTNPAYRHLVGLEDVAMHASHGQVSHSQAINVYYVESAKGSTSIAYCMVYCPGSQHNTVNTFVVMTRDVRNCDVGQQMPITLAHEFGHAMCRFWDIYEMDINHNIRIDPGENCTLNTWCPTEPMYCHEDAAYPEEPGSQTKTPKNLMWYSFCGRPLSDYDLVVGQYIESSDWMRAHEGSYPLPP